MGFLNFALALAALILAIVAVSIRAGRRIRRLEAQVWWLKDSLDRLRSGGAAPDGKPDEAHEAAKISRPEAEPAEASADLAMEAASRESVAQQDTARADTPTAATAGTAATGVATPAATAPEKRRESLEQQLTARWLVWLGGIALALATAFLFKFSIDRGWLTPAVRVGLGLAGAAVLGTAGEWLRRRAQYEPDSTLPYYVPAALSAAASFAAFGSLFAAHGLYDLIGASLALPLLGVVALGATGLAFLYGPFFAVLGVIGAYAVPALITSPDPEAWPLFLYLTAVAAAGAGVMRARAWWWLALLNLAGAMLWPLIWLAALWQPGDGFVLTAFLLVVLGLFIWAAKDAPAKPPDTETVKPLLGLSMSPADQMMLLAFATIASAFFILVRADAYSAVSLGGLWLFGLAAIGAGRWRPSLDWAPWISAAPFLLALSLWQTGYLMTPRQIGGEIVPPVEAPYHDTIWWTSLAYGLLYGGLGFGVLWGAARPWRWGVTASVPALLIFLAAYALTTEFERSLIWAGIALAIGALYLAGCAVVARYRNEDGMTGALGTLSLGVTAAVALAISIALFRSWLTTALAIEVLAIAWIHRRIALPFFWVAAILLAAVVFVRLALNPAVLTYPLSETPVLNWLLYGYGVPAVAFFLAGAWLRNRAPVWITPVLHWPALIFAVLLVSLQIHALSAPGDTPSLDHFGLDFHERSVHALAWLTGAVGLAFAARRWPHVRILPAGAKTVGAAAIVLVVGGQVLVSNPLFASIPVGDTPFFNWLAIAYALPAGLLVALRWLHTETLERLVAGVAALLLSFVWVTLEVRQLFQGSVLRDGAASDAEWYAYSAAWLVFGAALLAVGIWRKSTSLRYASLAIVMAAVAKVFVWDMSAITGLWRVLSFLALGLVLIAIGYFYRRYVFPREGTAESS